MIKTKNITISYKEYDKVEELNEKDRELVTEARSAAMRAYAPYSGFKVGAAVRLSSGKIICGANVENAAFPSGICAERTALSNSISNYPDDNPVAIAIASVTGDKITLSYPSPCGNCRQVIAEEEYRTGNKIRLLLSGTESIVVVDSIADLLPLQFDRSKLISLP
jgi:cytidine deaminase